MGPLSVKMTRSFYADATIAEIAAGAWKVVMGAHL
jgi:hypothetical protein